MSSGDWDAPSAADEAEAVIGEVISLEDERPRRRKLNGAHADPEADYEAEERSAIRGISWRPAADIARRIAEAESPRRLPIAAIPTLDRATRNGIPEGASVTITGAPGSCKTALAIQWAHEWALWGARVVILCTDQPPERAISRVGERLGLARDELDGLKGDPDRRAAWRSLAKDLEALPNFVCLDGGEDGATIEQGAEVLDKLEGDGPRVLFVDSIQEATCGLMAALGEQGMLSRVPKREQVDTAGRACRRIARRGILVVLVSEQSRAAYGASDERRRTNALASSKESGSIEYRTDMLMVLQRAKDPDLVDVSVPKSRLGEEVQFRLRMQRRRAALLEVEAQRETPTTREEAAASIRAEVQRDAAELAKVLAAYPEGLGTRELRANLRSAGMKWGPERIDAARVALQRGVNGVRCVNRSSSAKVRQWVLEPIGGSP